MDKYSNIKTMYLRLSILLAILCGITPHVMAQTLTGNVSGTLDVTASPYEVIGNITVLEGETLLIDPGVVLKFNSNASLTVLGILEAKGNIGSPIVFTSIHDDTFLGDTNGNGTATLPAPRDWQGIIAGDGNSSGTFQAGHIIVKFANSAIFSDNGVLNLSSANISNNFSNGIYASNGSTASIYDSQISSNQTGILISLQSSATIRNSIMERNNSTGVSFYDLVHLEISKSSISLNNAKGLMGFGYINTLAVSTNTISNNLQEGMTLPPDFKTLSVFGNSIEGNLKDYISFGNSFITRDLHWPKLDFPYVINDIRLENSPWLPARSLKLTL